MSTLIEAAVEKTSNLEEEEPSIDLTGEFV
ncbi:hypothetical protein A2U01_0077553, partial [Trifolium medium]|nr:hypothetical protein [Trifolium medium]